DDLAPAGRLVQADLRPADRQHGEGGAGQASRRSPRVDVPALRGSHPARGLPGDGQDDAGARVGQHGPGIPRADPVHTGPAALGRDRRDGLRPAQGDLRVPPGAHLPHDRAGRRDQPGVAQDPVGPSRGDGGEPGDRRRGGSLRGPALPGDRHPEPDRAGGHLPPARGPARPVPDEDVVGLSGPCGHDRAARQRRRPRPGLPRHPGDHRSHDLADERTGGPGLRRPRRHRLRRGAGRGVPPPAARQAGPVCPGVSGLHPRRQDVGGRGRPRPRGARRHQGARRARAVPPAAARCRGAVRRGQRADRHRNPARRRRPADRPGRL
ncbi:MAG: FIG022979: MoxR-like ATPases, partial [uncultured Nocardioides sp.]